MSANWYKIFNSTDFLAESLVSRTLVVDLEARGQETFEIFNGNFLSVAYDDTLLPINFLDQNPYVRDSYAVYEDASNDVWFGFSGD